MTAADLIGLLAVVAVSAYVQTLTGFAFGLLTIGGVGLLGLMSLPDAAVLVGLLTLVNAAQVLRRGWRQVALPELLLIMAAGIPGLALGYGLLEWLAGTRLELLRVVLGAVVVLSSLQLGGTPERRDRRSGRLSFLLAGAAGGLMGGLFSTAGPPLVFHLYRQPMPLAMIRETLVTVFMLNAVVRLGLVAAHGMPMPAVWAAALAAPAVMAATYAARRWPPPLPASALRALVGALLLLSGGSLAGPALLRLVQA